MVNGTLLHFPSGFAAMKSPLAQYAYTRLLLPRSLAVGTSSAGHASCIISLWVRRLGVSAPSVMARFTRKTWKGKRGSLSDALFFIGSQVTYRSSLPFCFCSVVALETRQYAIGDTITMQLMRRGKGVLIPQPKSKLVNVEQPIHLGGEWQRGKLGRPCCHLCSIWGII